jgi:mono/diheme cytochrome c family protein
MRLRPRGVAPDRRKRGSCAAAGLIVLLAAVLGAAPARAGDAERGRTIFALAGGCGCHTMADGPIGAGGKKIETPFGTFFGTNITSDPETGIGAWSDAEVDSAIRGGVLRGGEAEAPVMPYYWYAGMSDADAADLIAYLRTLPAERRGNRPHEGELPLARWAYRAWALLFAEQPVAPATAPKEGVERGRYLADHVSLCSDCHTPRTALGAVDRSYYMAGTAEGPGGEKVPNITPHATGIADWDAGDVASVLETGMLPNFDNVQGSMAEVVDGVAGGPGYKDASELDRRAIAEYVLSVAPIAHEVRE